MMEKLSRFFLFLRSRLLMTIHLSVAGRTMAIKRQEEITAIQEPPQPSPDLLNNGQFRPLSIPPCKTIVARLTTKIPGRIIAGGKPLPKPQLITNTKAG